MKKLFEISSEERNRILEMHQNATKKNYLNEAESSYGPLKIDSEKSALYTTCRPKNQSTWNTFKTKIASTKLKGVNWNTVFKESSAGSKFGIQGKYIWSFSQSPDDGYSPGPSNKYRFYNLGNDGVISDFAVVSYGCSTNQWLSDITEPRFNNDRTALVPTAVMLQLTSDFYTPYDGKIPDDIVLQLLKLIEAQPDLNQNVAQAIKVAKEGKLSPTQFVKDEELKYIKNHPRYKAIGGV